jgi:transposase
MTENLTLTTERVDDLPLLVAQMEQMDLPNLLDSHFRVNGNWQGLSPGWTTILWLAHILSQADHRLSYVQPWAAARLGTLQGLAGQPVRALDFSDDRLAYLLRAFSPATQWGPLEATLNRHRLRVYDLAVERVRIDTTTASGYWQVDADGLFQFGHSKDHRPDLAQLKVLLVTLDPLALPLVTDVLPGQRADDPLYLPAITRVRRAVERRALLYVGDSKMAALATRTFVVAGGDYYLCPLPDKQLPADWLRDYLADVADGSQPLVQVARQRADGTVSAIAVGYERPVALSASLHDQEICWTERRLVVRSLSAAAAAEGALRTRLAVAQQELAALRQRGRGKSRPADRAALDQATTTILERYQVADVLRVAVTEEWQERQVRAYHDRPARVARTWDFQLHVSVADAPLAARIARLGWRVYATNQPIAELSLEQAVVAYRGEYLIEQSFARLKGVPLSLRPCYVQRDDHAQGLVRLLALGLRVLSLLEFRVRRQLSTEGASLVGLYKGQPTATTRRPTAERLLEQFEEITLTIIEHAGQHLSHLTVLSAVQQHIVALLGFGPDLYAKLVADSAQPP